MKNEKDNGQWNKDVLFSTGKNDWQTPNPIFDALNHEFGFDLDAAAAGHNALCSRFFDISDDALTRDWNVVERSTVWCNPPYSRAVGVWLQKGADQAKIGVTSVFMVMARVETRWWHEVVMKHACEVRLVKGRVHFTDANEPEKCEAAPAPSCLIIFRPCVSGPPRFVSWEQPDKEKARVKTERASWNKMKKEQKKGSA